MKKGKVLLGMSGGIDSSVSAILLQEQGFEVLGCTFDFFEGENNSSQKKEIVDLKNDLEIRHIFVDLKKEFKTNVVQYFVDGYLNGETPFPCAVCNPWVKWKNLIIQAEKNKCDFVATGHYAQIKNYNAHNFIYKGIDEEKDQSFFLWGLEEKVLNKCIFPLGNLYKNQVREIARERGFEDLSEKKDSLGICFNSKGSYRDFILMELNDKNVSIEEGDFVNSGGTKIGRHKGYPFYTIGQRRGLGIHLNKPVFVSEIRPESNEIVIADYKDLFRNMIEIENYFFNNPNEIIIEKTWTVKIRYRNQNTPCKIEIHDNRKLTVKLLEPLESIAPGQTAVFYDNDRVVGGGFIKCAT